MEKGNFASGEPHGERLEVQPASEALLAPTATVGHPVALRGWKGDGRQMVERRRECDSFAEEKVGMRRYLLFIIAFIVELTLLESRP